MPVTPTEFGITGFAFPVVAGSSDYPAESDVRDGVAFDFGIQTGTLELPAESDVRDGVGFGDGGTEFTGTLVVDDSTPSTGLSIGGDYVYVDGTETITHITSGGASATVQYALRQPYMIQDQSGAWISDSTKSTWQIWHATLAHSLAPGHEFQQADGTKWIVEEATKDQLTGKWEVTASRKQVSG